MSTSLVLFDIDGTLIDTAGAGRCAIERAFRMTFGTAAVAVQAAGVEFAGRTDPVILQDIARALAVTGSDYAARRIKLERVFLQELAHEMSRNEPRRRVLPGVVDLLEDLAARPDVWLGLVTGNLEAGARLKLGAFGLNRFFPAGGFSSDDPDRRQIARIARERVEARAGIEFAAERVTVVGDTPHDVDCAHANRFRSVAVDSGWVPRATLERARPDHLLNGLADRPRALAALGLV